MPTADVYSYGVNSRRVAAKKKKRRHAFHALFNLNVNEARSCRKKS